MGDTNEEMNEGDAAMEGLDALDNMAEMDAEVEMAMAEFDMADDVGGDDGGGDDGGGAGDE